LIKVFLPVGEGNNSVPFYGAISAREKEETPPQKTQQQESRNAIGNYVRIFQKLVFGRERGGTRIFPGGRDFSGESVYWRLSQPTPIIAKFPFDASDWVLYF